MVLLKCPHKMAVCLFDFKAVNLCREVFCPIVGCGARLTSTEDFENHYNARHTACCSVCSRVYPTSRLLSIHVSEAHDSFFQAKVARGYDMVPS
ncbi:hypothetical protein RIF29_29009 [Crotalaria pallida]|uniref:C2H2-type domain-containing protein n=1 Tax=Crotalaria pallida TaxID=3830 RepID=A0AAN9HZY4_CROPI